jgi:hypothetical protein
MENENEINNNEKQYHEISINNGNNGIINNVNNQ